MIKNEIKPVKLDFTDNDLKQISNKISEIFKSGNLILGKYTNQFEKKFAEYINVKEAVALNSGTSALEVAITLSIKSNRFYSENKKKNNLNNKKKILVQSNTNFATIAAIIRSGATPIFLDIDEKYFSPSYNQIVDEYKKHKQIAGLVIVHIGGIIHPDVNKIANFCKKNRIFFIEDCAHSHGSTFNGKKAGSFGDYGCFSFFPTKVITTIEGGMITTNNSKSKELIKSFRNQGKRGGAYGGIHYDLGNSWRISEISAYVGLLQLKRLNHILKKKNKIVKKIINYIKKSSLLNYCRIEHMDLCANYKLIILAKNKSIRQDLLKKFKDKKIYVGGDVYGVPCHKQPVFKNYIRKKIYLSSTDKYCELQICPPVHSGLLNSEIKRICSVIEKFK